MFFTLFYFYLFFQFDFFKLNKHLFKDKTIVQDLTRITLLLYLLHYWTYCINLRISYII